MGFAIMSAATLAGAHAVDAGGKFLIVCGALTAIAATVVLVYAYRKHMRRIEALKVGHSANIRPEDFGDKCGPYMLATCLTVVVAMLILAPVVQHVTNESS